MMEQAINTFEEGLVMDLNPLTTPSNVLTNCLNGTFVTYNGNEFVLQNDDGNGRVETAYLPSGYVPVGIKEYGGIIYVASYNPITNKGQIGSFPSPERNISSEEKGVAEFSLSPRSFGFEGKTDTYGNLIEDAGSFEITSVEDSNKESIGVNTAYTKLALLKDTSILRPGDKFAIQFSIDNKDKLALLGDWIENYYNTTGTSNLRLLKIKIAISDSNGYLIDITKNLKRIANGELVWPVPRSSNETEEDWKKRQYDGYFMQLTENNEYTPPSLEDTRRAEKFLNVYNNKLAGTLYLVAELSTIDSYELQVKGVQTEYTEGEETKHGAKVGFTTSYTSDILDTYKELVNNPEDYWYGNKIELALDGTSLRDTINLVGKEVQYGDSKERNKGLQSIELNLTEEEKKAGTGVLTYDFLPNMKYGKLESYRKSGFIDLNLLGSGKVTLNKWQYYTNLQEGYSIIRFGFAAYPAEGESITKVVFTFYNIKDYVPGKTPVGIVKEIPNRASWHGDFQEILYYGQELKPMTLYVVAIDLYDGKGRREDWSTSRWLYTTELFNDSFNGNKVLGLDSGGTWNDFNTFNPYPKVALKSGLDISNSNYSNRVTYDTVAEQTSSFGKFDEPLYYKYSKDINYVWEYNPDIDIKYSNKYPFTLDKANIDFTQSIVTTSKVDPTSKIPVGVPSTLPENIVKEAYVEDSVLTVKLSLENYLTGKATVSKSVSGNVIESYMREENIQNVLGWPSTSNYLRLNTWLSSPSGEKRQIYFNIEWYVNRVHQGTKSRDIYWSNRDGNNTAQVGWKNEGTQTEHQNRVLNFLTLVGDTPSDVRRGDIMILTIDKVGDAEELYTMFMMKDGNGDYVLMNAKGSALNSDGYNILVKLLGHILTPSPERKTFSVYVMGDPNYWDNYTYLWDLSLDLTITQKSNDVFLINSFTFNNLVSAFVNKISVSNTISDVDKLTSKKCVKFEPDKNISDVKAFFNEKAPLIHDIVNSYTNPSFDGMVFAIDYNNNVYNKEVEGELLRTNVIYACINNNIYDVSKQYSLTGNDAIKFDIAKSMKLNLSNSSRLVIDPGKNTRTGGPVAYTVQHKGGDWKKAEWWFTRSANNTQWFSQIDIFRLDPTNLTGL